MTRDEAVALARASPWLSGQSVEFQDELLGHCRLVERQRGEYVYHMGDQAPEIFFLAEGVALLSAAHPVLGLVNGQVLHPGRWFGEAAGLSQRTRLVSVEVRRPCFLLAFPAPAIFQSIHSNPGYATAWLDLMATASEDYMLHAIDLMIQSPHARLCSRLLTFAGRTLQRMPPASISIPLSQEEIALASGMSRQTVNQILRKLVEAGICSLGYGEIFILDTAALARQIS